ncbi:hypothetical protein NEOLEDRAFT_1152038 [Neolentinus lepideus HHB14362 ss-1]|uniref:MULE transposase domain-containing protein n=1 Tax=Neolentinus lepideus HHB14362 ss-1 TaxID=1314782 RepID=A0A165N9P0_9AGAM|nr:hypothetical protein NEOLEDRAFT_1152038 [Neolentinus lepideus HHB14362 ss-1]
MTLAHCSPTPTIKEITTVLKEFEDSKIKGTMKNPINVLYAGPDEVSLMQLALDPQHGGDPCISLLLPIVHETLMTYEVGKSPAEIWAENSGHGPDCPCWGVEPQGSYQIPHEHLALLLNIPKLQQTPSNAATTAPSKLFLTEDLWHAMDLHLKNVPLNEVRFSSTLESQAQAHQMIQQLDLYLPEIWPQEIQAKLAIRNTNKWTIGKAHTYCHVMRLYQCGCGTDHTTGHQGSKSQGIPWTNMGCMFWVEITTTHVTVDKSKAGGLLTIDQISGILDHSAMCQDLTEMNHEPIAPLHPEIREYALNLLCEGWPMQQVRTQTEKWRKEKFGDAPSDTHFRFMLHNEESLSLYRTLVRESSVGQCSADNPQPPPRYMELQDSVMFYQPHVEGTMDWFILIISTKEMHARAWNYGHNGQLLMDGMFGFTSDRLLLFTLMAIDDCNCSIPVAYMLFSARQEAKATHADYNGELLSWIVQAWRDAMGKNVSGEVFCAHIGIMDNDPKERRSLSEAWEEILLLLCLTHTWRAWGNSLNRYLRVIPKGPEQQLREVIIYEEAVGTYNVELKHFKLLSKKHDAISKKQSTGGLAFLAYFSAYLKSRAFWLAWSRVGVLEAAKLLNKSPDQVPQMANHLESHQGHLKGTYAKAHLHGNRLPWADFWVLMLINEILPTFFQSLDNASALNNWYHQLRISPTPSDPDASDLNGDTAAGSAPDMTDEACALFDEVIHDPKGEDLEQDLGEDPSAMEGYGQPLQIDESDESSFTSEALFSDGSHFTTVGSLASMATSDSGDSSEQSLVLSNTEIALDSSDILADLSDIGVSSSPPPEMDTSFDSAPSLSLAINALGAISISSSADSAQRPYHNEEVMALQEFLLVQDTCIWLLRRLTSLKGEAFAEDLYREIGHHAFHRPVPLLSPPPHSKSSSLAQDLTLTQTWLDNDPQMFSPDDAPQLACFQHQWKECRHESHGCR